MAETVQDNLSVTESTGSSSISLSVTEANSVVQLESSGNSLRLTVDAPSGASIGTVNAFPFDLRTGGEPRLLVEGNGNVGIGTTAPLTAKLEVAGAVKIQNNLTVQGDLELGNDDTDQVKIHGIVRSTHSSSTLQFESPLKVAGKITTDANWTGEEGALTLTGDKPTIRFTGGAVSGNQSWILHLGSHGPGNLEFFKRTGASSWNSVLSMTPSGNVGIGTIAPEQKLHVAGGHIHIDLNRSFGLNIHDKFVYDGKDIGHYSLGWFSDSWNPGAATAWLSGWAGIKLFTAGSLKFSIDRLGNTRYMGTFKESSRELKEKVADLSAQKAVNTLEGLNPVTYHLKADEEKNLQIGFIAEDVPDLVASRDRKAVSTDHIVAILTKVVKEQQAAIAELTEKVNALEAQQL